MSPVDLFAGRRPLFILILPIFISFIFSASVFIHKSPGFRVDKTQYGLKIGEIHSSINAVEKGDLIVRINGLEYNRVLSFALTGGQAPGESFSITVLRERTRLDIPVFFEPVSPFEFLSSASPHFVLILVLLSLGVLSFLRAGSGQPTGLFLAMVCFFATSFSATFPSHFGILDPFIISLSFFCLAVCNWLAFGACLHFVCIFPDERNLIQDRKWLKVLLYLLPAFVPLAGAFVLSGLSYEFWEWLQRLRNIMLPGMAVAIFLKHLIDFRHIRSSIARNQVKIITNAYWLSFGPYMILYLLPNIMFNQPFIPFRFVVISGIILPAAYFIALIKYRLLDVDRMISRTVSYFLIIALLALSYSYFVIFLKRHFMGSGILSEELFLVYVILVALFFGPVLKLISRVMDRLFLPKNLYRYDRVPGLSMSIGTCLHLGDLVRIMTRSLLDDILISKSCLIVLGRPKPDVFPRTMDSRTLYASVDPLKTFFAGGSDHIFVKGVSSDPVPDEIAELGDHDTEIVFALRGGTGMTGLWLVGPRKDARAYTRQDVRMFQTIANQAGVALENARHYGSLTRSKKQIEKMFAKVVEAEKMAALGKMSTVLAHELKNPLGIIRSSAQFLKEQHKGPDTDAELLEYIIGEVDGLTSVINNMMGLARYKKPEMTDIDPGVEISGMITRWQASENHSASVDISLETETGLPHLKADLKQLQQVFLNCITNSEQAMPDGGSIWVKVYKKDVRNLGASIEDSGPGIPKEHLKNAFTQFFTTREKGMGIGLSVCRQIVGAHDGTIRLENRKEGGLRVAMTLPFNSLAAVDAVMK